MALYFSSHTKGSHFSLIRIVVKFTGFPDGFLMSRQSFQSLMKSGLSSSELIIVAYLIDMCNEWGFTTECEKTLSEFFEIDISSVYRRISKLKKLDIVKKVEYNGRIGFMINPLYCYQGALHLRRFRVKLWDEGTIYTTSRPDRFYGPPIYDTEDAKRIAARTYSRARFKLKSKKIHTQR